MNKKSTTTTANNKPQIKGIIPNRKKQKTESTSTTSNTSPSTKTTPKNKENINTNVETPKQNQQSNEKDKKRKKLDEEDDEEEDLGVIPDSSDDDDDKDESESEEEEVINNKDDDYDENDDSDFDEITADFGIEPCNDNDYHSIKGMMNRLIPYTASVGFDSSEITDLILEQCKKTKFGRSLRVEGTEDPYGFMSVLNYKLVDSKPSIKGYIDYILQKLKDSTTESEIKNKKDKSSSTTSILEKVLKNAKKESVGLVFSERFLNIPKELVYPMNQYIHWDIELLTEKDKSYDYKYYLYLTSFGITDKSEDDEEEVDKNGKGRGKGNKSKQQTKQENQHEIGKEVYHKIEDKILKKLATFWSTFNIPYEYGKGSRWTLEGHIKRKGLIMLVPSSAIPEFLQTLKIKSSME
eukprot:gene5054-6291_t